MRERLTTSWGGVAVGDPFIDTLGSKLLGLLPMSLLSGDCPGEVPAEWDFFC